VVVYKAGAKADLPAFLAGLKTSCFSSDVGGFSNVLPTLFSHAENETIMITTLNFTTAWDHSFAAEYDTAFPAGSARANVQEPLSNQPLSLSAAYHNLHPTA
jgi:hypothetical protein